jgi:hypothetical protein
MYPGVFDLPDSFFCRFVICHPVILSLKSEIEATKVYIFLIPKNFFGIFSLIHSSILQLNNNENLVIFAPPLKTGNIHFYIIYHKII